MAQDNRKIITAGILSGIAFIAAEAADKQVFKERYSDMKFVGMVFTRKDPEYLFIGVPFHLFISVIFAFVYNKILGPRLFGPGWLRGLTMALIENNSLWFTLIPLANKIHPALKDGSMKQINLGGKDWLAGMDRHIALGIVLGLLCPIGKK